MSRDTVDCESTKEQEITGEACKSHSTNFSRTATKIQWISEAVHMNVVSHVRWHLHAISAGLLVVVDLHNFF
jgi:hypothetical protein